MRPVWIILILVLALLAAGTLATVEVIDAGPHVLPYPEAGTPRLIKVWGVLELRVSAESHSPDQDVTNAIVLVIAGSVALFSGLLLRGIAGADRLRRFFLIGGGGAFYAAADETLGFHETIGHNLLFLREPLSIEHPDNLVMAVYGVLAVWFLWTFRDVLLSVRLASRIFALGGALAVALIVSDFAGDPLGFEEGVLERGTALMFVAGFVVLGLERVRSELQQRPRANVAT